MRSFDTVITAATVVPILCAYYLFLFPLFASPTHYSLHAFRNFIFGDFFIYLGCIFFQIHPLAALFLLISKKLYHDDHYTNLHEILPTFQVDDGAHLPRVSKSVG